MLIILKIYKNSIFQYLYLRHIKIIYKKFDTYDF
ncbi:hypothetical protein CWS_00335 [Buchnera aphidicola str. JF99 (Acyrthosiphon pisum)]|nr:hypothetical protein CWO_00325 [Buchnera aphidicola str. LL01 (Acyrthosiphon pisum)]ADP66467.1 hypothetical protein CWQ_00355 [Buchnera aphidicola str. TLW03 (Acyrthosiphon pisum)]ADP67046.1 hypothetical protein CWS_00335 [Buchnera aphidicola str. JF99 (Acyrthosiphon pisum)]ADP67621.1 hypothetical protein CWU_00425 [Buchnera aphidicola str. JF98 (Acyrthosiphon pisum)]